MSARSIEVATASPYTVHVGCGILPGTLEELREAGPAAVLSDANVAPLHLSRLAAPAGVPLYTIEPGEGSKSFAVLEQVLEFLAERDLDRSSLLVALGGGVVGDLCGLAAALYMRGIRWIQCPTTLLAQVDASVGGKTAVNLAAGKNLAGSFHQPAAVWADVETLGTLPEEEYRSGLGEVVKSALIGDAALLELLEEQAAALREREMQVLQEVVGRCVRVKAAVVARDERESGERKALNLGHTFAHAIELAAGFGVVPHGVAVGVGLLLALQASEASGIARGTGLEDRVAALFAELGLCASLQELRQRYARALSPEQLTRALRHDKKSRAGRPAWVLLRDLGDPIHDAELDPALLAALLR